MIFEETGNIITVKKHESTFIYFLINKGEVVYVGKALKGISFPFSCGVKDFDTVKAIACPGDMLNSEQDRFITKYKPKYNDEILENEIWAKIKDHPNYSVSNKGRVRNDKRERMRKTYIDKDGYLFVVLFRNKSNVIYRVHKLVANAFIPNPDNKPCVDHIDTNKLNNNVDNLRWVTQKENCNNPLTKLHRKQSQAVANQKISAALKGRKKSEETKRKMIESRKNRSEI